MTLDWSQRTYVMGIVNVTPDSFSGDGILSKDQHPVELAVQQALRFVEEGADILDIGGESTRPGSAPVSVEEELKRVIPVIKAIREKTDALISIDTYKGSVARAALEAGANWINDVWGMRMDPEMVEVAAEFDCPIILMHNRSKPKDVASQEKLGGRYIGVEYEDLIPDIKRELKQSIDTALKNGIKESNIIIDPGVGFGKTVEQNLQILKQLDSFKDMGYPILLGVSRKSVIGYTLDLPPDQRLEGTLAANIVGITKGANILRVHDVLATVRAAKMTDAILRS